MGSVRRRMFVFLMFTLGPACLGGGGKNNKPPPTLPSDPTSLVAPVLTTTTARIILSWIDTSDNEDEFRIERSDDGGATYAQIATAPRNSQTYTDLGLLPGTEYYYRVAAWNSLGYSAFATVGPRTTKGLSWTAGDMTTGPGIGKAMHSAIFDSADIVDGGQRMIVFGGMDDFGEILNEVWSYNPAGDWTLLPPVGPTPPPLPRFGHSAIYDSAHRRMIVFGGRVLTPPLVYQNDVHVLDLSTMSWLSITVTGTPPSQRAFHSAVYDSVNERMLVYGGKDSGGVELSDVYALSLNNAAPYVWSSPGVGARPVGRDQHASIFDPVNSRMILFAGQDNETILDGSLLANDTWTFTTFGWSQLFFTGTPSFRVGHTAVYDEANQRMVVFGGNDNTAFIPTAEMWGLKLYATPSWSILNPTSGPPPPARWGHSAVYDSGMNRMIIYGGFDDFGFALDEVWRIDL